MVRTLRILATSTLLATTVHLSPAQAATFTFPSGACSGTLQECIDGAPSGSTIKIATNTPISASADITIEDKSLTLRPKAGFNPVIEGTSPASPYALELDVGAGSAPTTMRVTGITVRNMQLSIQSNDDDQSLHKFIVTNSRVYQPAEHNNTPGVDIDLRSRAKAVLLHNVVRSNGQTIEVSHDSALGRTYARIEANRTTSVDPAFAYTGIQNRFSGSSLGTTDIFDNVIHDAGGCNCGGPSGIEASSSGNGVTNIVGNTIDLVRIGSPGIDVEISPSAMLRVNIFNNSISRADGGAVAFPAADPDLEIKNAYNNFFNNSPADVGGYPLGPHTSDQNPRFMDVSNGNFKLRPNSPLIDRGLICQAGGLGRMDPAGRFRLVKPSIDIGAYEFGSSRKPPKGKNVFGDNANNDLDGTGGQDIVCGLGGKDVIRAGGKTDWVDGGADKDRSMGQGGADVVKAGKGNRDLASGGRGKDLVATRDNDGSDKAIGGGDNDTCRTDPGDTRRNCE